MTLRSSSTPVFQVGDYVKRATVDVNKSIIQKVVAVQLDMGRYQTVVVYHPSDSSQVGNTGFINFTSEANWSIISESQVPGETPDNGGTIAGFPTGILIVAGVILAAGAFGKKRR
jgi:hypothetical protein